MCNDSHLITDLNKNVFVIPNISIFCFIFSIIRWNKYYDNLTRDSLVFVRFLCAIRIQNMNLRTIPVMDQKIIRFKRSHMLNLKNSGTLQQMLVCCLFLWFRFYQVGYVSKSTKRVFSERKWRCYQLKRQDCLNKLMHS